MPVDFPMPKLGLTMTQGTILEWLVPDGADVTDGTAVLLIETDKTETEIEVNGNGRLVQRAAAGDSIPCGDVVGVLLAPGESVADAVPSANGGAAVSAITPSTDIGAASASASGASRTFSAPANGVTAGPIQGPGNGRMFVSPNARRVSALHGVELAGVVGTGPGGRIVSEDVEAAARSGSVSAASSPTAGGSSPTRPIRPTETVSATAAARQLADLLGVDIAAVDCDPIDGRVTRETVAQYVRRRLDQRPAATRPVADTPAATVAASITGSDALAQPLQVPTRMVRMTGMRGTIARRMHASLQQMAQLTLTMEANVDAVVADRRRRADTGAAPGYTDYIVAAAARALQRHPIVNAQVTAAGIAVLPEIHVGLAVALDDGLVVPVVRNADRLALSELAVETTRLAIAARAGSLGPGDMEGGTFSVTALGGFGVDAFTPIINPPEAAILGVGRIRDRLRLRDGVVVTEQCLTLSLTWDHRVFDGAPAAQFCRTVVELLADPSSF